MLLARHYVLAVLFYLIFTGLDTLIIIAEIKAHDQLETSKFENLADIGQNWRRGPIKSFTPSCSVPNVQSVDAEWAGTVDGCKQNSELSRGPCKRDKSNSTFGTNILAVPPVKLTIWKDITLCADTMGRYLDLNVVGKNETCPGGTKKCGLIDSLDNILCVKDADECPVTQIMFSQKEETGYTAIKGDGVFLNYLKVPTESSIPVQFKMSERNICADLNQIDTNRTLYTLEEHYNRSKCTTEIASNLTNPFFKHLDVSTVEKVYSLNGVNEWLKILPEYNFEGLKVPMNLSSRSHIGIKLDCKDRISGVHDIENKFIELGENVDWLIDFSYIIKILALIFCSLDIVFNAVLCFMIFDRRLFFGCGFVFGMFTVGFQIALIVLNIIAKSYIDEIDFGFAFIGYEGCSDAITNESIILFDGIIRSSADYFGWLWVINLIYFILFPSLTIGLGCLLDKEED